MGSVGWGQSEGTQVPAAALARPWMALYSRGHLALLDDEEDGMRVEYQQDTNALELLRMHEEAAQLVRFGRGAGACSTAAAGSPPESSRVPRLKAPP